MPLGRSCVFIFATNQFSDSVFKAQTDENYMNTFISKHKKFILISAFRATKRFISENDDEYSVAMIAFCEAIKSYEESKGSFKGFAFLVIKRRLTDYSLSQACFQKELSVEPASMDGEIENEEEVSALQIEIRQRSVEISAAEGVGVETPGSTPMQDEIAAVQNLLSGYNFSFFDLTECSPKAEKTKIACAKAVAVLLQNPTLFKKMQSTKTLPVKDISSGKDISVKILERHRKYIIAAAEIMQGDYPLLKEYMSYIRKALESEL